MQKINYISLIVDHEMNFSEDLDELEHLRRVKIVKIFG